MDCSAFESFCQSRLDDRLPLSNLGELPGLSAHLSLCETCRATALRFGLLDTAIDSWRERPVARPDLTDRILAAVLEDRRPLPFATRHRRSLIAAAALLIATVGLGIRATWNPPRPHVPEVASKETAPPLEDVLAAATTATLDLARKTSEPATKVGSRMIASAKLPSSPRLSLNVPIRPASHMISALGDDVNRGVKPISGTARNAFGFLLAPWSREAPKETPRDGQGA